MPPTASPATDAIVARLEAFPRALAAVVQGLAPADWRFRPAAGAWSVLEVVNHLADEEGEDFRARLSLVLSDPEAPWPPIDPAKAVVERAFQDRDPAESLSRFAAERARSVAWLRSLRGPAWGNAHRHAEAGEIRAGDLLASWAAHDARHLGQVAKRLHEIAARDGGPYSVAYAG